MNHWEWEGVGLKNTFPLTSNYDCLLSVLQRRFAIDGSALDWFRIRADADFAYSRWSNRPCCFYLRRPARLSDGWC